VNEQLVTLASPSRRRAGALAAVVAVLGVGLVVGLRPKHAPPASSPAPKAAPAPVAVAPPVVVGLDEGVAAAPRAEPVAPAANETSTAEIAPRAHRRRPLGRANHLAPASHNRKLAKPQKPAGDREGAHAAYQQGNSLLLTGDANGAVAAYQDAVRLAPADPAGYRGLGLAYEKEGKIPDAISALVSYLKLSRHARDREVIARRLHRLTHPNDN
jgi:hypothetical protein